MYPWLFNSWRNTAMIRVTQVHSVAYMFIHMISLPFLPLVCITRYKLVLAPFLQCDVCLEEILSYVFLDTIKLDLAVWYSFFLLDFAESSHCKQFNWIFLISLIYNIYSYSNLPVFRNNGRLIKKMKFLKNFCTDKKYQVERKPYVTARGQILC